METENQKKNVCTLLEWSPEHAAVQFVSTQRRLLFKATTIRVIKGVELKQYALFKCGAGAVIMQSNFKKAVFWGAHSYATLVNISI